jgi:hypothetical protein
MLKRNKLLMTRIWNINNLYNPRLLFKSKSRIYLIWNTNRYLFKADHFQ